MFLVFLFIKKLLSFDILSLFYYTIFVKKCLRGKILKNLLIQWPIYFVLNFITIILITIILYITLVSDNNIYEITEYNINSNKIDEKLKIVHISDLHNAKFGENNIDLVNNINEINPDLILITGDMFDANTTDLENTLNFFRNLSNTNLNNIYYTPGNHEAARKSYYENLKVQIKEEKLNIKILENEIETITIKNNNINISGISKEYLMNGKAFNELYNTINDKTLYNIVLCHYPERWENTLKNEKLYLGENLDFDCNLILTGHAHGGQIRLFNQGMFAPDQGYLPKYTSGLINITENEKEVISRGLGNSTFPIRINNKPELIVININ